MTAPTNALVDGGPELPLLAPGDSYRAAFSITVSRERHLAGLRWRRVGPAHHAEPVDQPEQAGEDRDEQRDLQRERPRVGVDADDLVLDLRRLVGELLLELRCCSSPPRPPRAPAATCSCSAAGSTVLSSAIWVNAIESVASMIAPANASPNDSPKDPAAELTPAASLTRSSEIGESV